jgi:hypothetical protein
VSGFGGPALYEIRVAGVLDGRWAAWFDGLQISGQGEETVISGLVADQAALHGVLTNGHVLDDRHRARRHRPLTLIRGRYLGDLAEHPGKTVELVHGSCPAPAQRPGPASPAHRQRTDNRYPGRLKTAQVNEPGFGPQPTR